MVVRNDKYGIAVKFAHRRLLIDTVVMIMGELCNFAGTFYLFTLSTLPVLTWAHQLTPLWRL